MLYSLTIMSFSCWIAIRVWIKWEFSKPVGSLCDNNIYIYILGHLADAFDQSDLQLFIHTLMAVVAMQGADQHIRSSLG